MFRTIWMVTVMGALGFPPASADEPTLYGVSSDFDCLITIDPETGQGTQVGYLDVDIENTGVGFDSEGNLYGLSWMVNADEYRLYTIDLNTGHANEIGPLNLGLSQKGTDLAVDTHGKLIGVVGRRVIEINPENGQGTILFSLPSKYVLHGADFSVGGELYATGTADSKARLLKIDVAKMSYKVIAKLKHKCTDICFDASGLLYGSKKGDTLVLIDPASGQLTTIGSFVFPNVPGLDFHPSPLEEDANTLSEVTGGMVDFALKAGTINANRDYLMLGCMSGTEPGIALPGGQATMPLHWDLFTNTVIGFLNTAIFQNFMGTLYSDGTGAATFYSLGPLPPGTAGITMSFAYALNKPWNFVSNPVQVEIVP